MTKAVCMWRSGNSGYSLTPSSLHEFNQLFPTPQDIPAKAGCRLQVAGYSNLSHSLRDTLYVPKIGGHHLIPDSGEIMGSVQLGLMRQLAEARHGDDDWTGLRDQTERRKRQTRLALRAYRTCFRALFYTRSLAIGDSSPGSR